MITEKATDIDGLPIDADVLRKCVRSAVSIRLQRNAAICYESCSVIDVITSLPVTDCGLPPEFCEYGTKFESCKPWLIAHVPHLYPQLVSPPTGNSAANAADTASAHGDRPDAGSAVDGDVAAATAALSGVGISAAPALPQGAAVAPGDASDGDGDADGAKKKKSKKAGQAGRSGPKKREGGVVTVTVKDRGRRKYVTTISGLEAYETIKLKEAASALGKKFGAGASVTKSPEGKPEIDIQGDVSDDIATVLAALCGISEDAVVLRD